MKAVTAAKVGLLVVWTLSGLTGCANRPKPMSVEPSVQAGQSEMAGAGEREEIQSLQERSLVLLFRGLLLMDDRPGLGIQKTQAERMLPLVRKSVDSGEMNVEAKKQIVNLLTKEQRDFLGGTGDRLRRFEPETGADADSPETDKSNGGDVSPAPTAADDSMNEGDWPGREESVEQQLLDRLGSKLQ